MNSTERTHAFPARRQQADDTRARLLQLAWDMVRAEGPSAFTMRRLAQAANVASGLPHAHFASREHLLDQLRIRFWDELDQTVGRHLEEHPEPPGPRLHERTARAALHAVVRFALAEPHLYSLIALTPGSQLTDAVFTREVQTAQVFITLLVTGQQAGEFAFPGDPIVFALALWTSLQGYIHRLGAQVPDVFRSFQVAVLDEIFDAFFDRIRVADPRE